METQPVTDDLLPARELALDLSPLIVAAVALPGRPPFLCDRLDMAVALGGLGVETVKGMGESCWASYDRPYVSAAGEWG